MILPEGGEARPAPPEKHLARRGASARHFGFSPLEKGALSSATASQLESKDRVRLRGMVDDAVGALSWMHGETHRPKPAFVDRRCETEKRLRLHSTVLQRLEQRSLLYLRADCALSPEDALSSVLKGRSVYDGGPATNTAPYKSSAVSLPDDVSNSPFLDELLPPTEQAILVGFHRQMLRPIRAAGGDQSVGVPPPARIRPATIFILFVVTGDCRLGDLKSKNRKIVLGGGPGGRRGEIIFRCFLGGDRPVYSLQSQRKK
jgi:hypothetical protein